MKVSMSAGSCMLERPGIREQCVTGCCVTLVATATNGHQDGKWNSGEELQCYKSTPLPQYSS